MTETNTKLSAAQALKRLNGISKKRLYEMMNNGDISYNTEPWGNKTRRVIEPSELARVFGSKYQDKKIETKQETVSNKKLKPPETIETTIENKLLEQENKMLREQIHALREDVKDWKQQAQTLLLQRPPETPEKKKGFWGGLFGS